MNIETAIILCAGYGKRVKPITDKIPKPLINIKNINLLDNTIKLVENLGIKKIKLNTHYLGDQIKDFINKKNYQLDIQITHEEIILNTGGGISNIIKNISEQNFLVFNPDTIWSNKDVKTVNAMSDFYNKYKPKNILLVVNKNKSFDKRFLGDFNLKDNLLSKDKSNDFIYTGCQILNKKIFKDFGESVFSISDIWDQLLQNNELYGFESLNEFVHLTDIEIYKRLQN